MIGDKITELVDGLDASFFMTIHPDYKFDLQCLRRIRNWALTQLPVEFNDHVILAPSYIPQGDFRGQLEPGMTGVVGEIYLGANERSWRISFLADHDGRTYATIPIESVLKTNKETTA